LAADDFINYIVAPCVRDLNYGDPIRADHLPDPGRITSQIIEYLNNADLVIADLSGGNPNAYYELSYRHAIGKPAIHMALEGTVLPFDVADNRTIFYTMHAREVELAKDKLKGQITRTHEPGYKVRNPILDAIGLLALEKSTDPAGQVLALIGRELASVRGDIAEMRPRLAAMQLLGSAPAGYLGLDRLGRPIANALAVFTTSGNALTNPGAGLAGGIVNALSPGGLYGPEARDATERQSKAKDNTGSSSRSEPVKR
jgi:hypothetical protein